MAEVPRPSSSGSLSWRARPGTGPDATKAKKTKRVLLTILTLALAVLLVWVLWPSATQSVHIFCLPIIDYDVLAVPPIPFADEDAAALLKSAPHGSAVPLKDLQTSDVIPTLGDRLQEDLGSPKNALILYLVGHGVSDDGTAYLLCSDYLWKQNAGRCEIGKLLVQMHSCKARVKLLVLDAGQLMADPRLGMLVNEFPHLVEEKVRAIPDPDLWVLMANRPLGTPAISYPAKRSVFGYYVTEALGGAADLNPKDGVVGLAELVDYVHTGVADWSSRDTSGQPPRDIWLLRGGKGSALSADDLEMAKNTALLSLLRRPVENKTDADSAQQAANGQKADAPTSPPESERNSERNRVKILLEQAWKLHDRALSRDGKMAWSPVDYAPHLWREFEGLLLGYESRYRGGKTFDENKLAEGLSTDLVPLKELLEHAEHAERADRGASAWVGVESTVVDRLAKAQQQFLNGPARTYEKEQEEVSALRTAVQLKNDLLFRAPYYLRWREHVARSSQQPTRLDEPIAKLLKELKEYLVLLSPLNEEKLAGKTTGDLQVLREALGQKKIVLEKLRDTIERVELEKVFMEVIADPGKEGNAGKIEGLLSTPLLPAPERIRLLSALDSPGKAGQMGTLDSPTKFQAVEPSIAQWQRDRLEEQAELEVLLVQLVDSQFAVGDRPSGQDTGQENPQSVEFWQKNRVLGKRLGDFYQDLPEKINGLIDSGDRSKSHFLDRLLLVVDARDAGEIKKEATLAAFRPLQLPLTPIPEPPKKPEFDAGPMKPDRIDLQVRRVFAADVGSTEPWMKENSLLRLRPFPNRTTSYCFELVNRSPREKTVEVKLYALTTSPEKQSQAWQKLLDAKGNTGDLPRAIFRPLLPKPVEMKLPSDPAPKAIPFPEPKSEKPAKPEKEAPKSEPAKDKEAEFQSLPEIPYPYVLVCVIRDTVEKGQKWVKQIELAPQKPSEYLEPEVNYDFQRGRITIDVRPRSEFLPPFSEEDPIYAPLSEEAPIRIVWRTEKEFGADTPLKNKAKITSADQTPQLFAGVGPDVRRVVEVSLDVDDYPRAFVYKVPLDRKRSKIPQERDLRHIQIFSPEDNLAYRSPLDPLGPPIVVEFQVDAPEDAFQEPGERVELTVLDADHDRELCPDEKRPFFGDRQVDLRLAGVNLQGEVKIATKVTDFKVPVGKRGLEGLTNIKARFRAQLYLHHRVAAGSPPMVSDVQVVFDGSPPKLGPLVVPSATVAQGDMLNASIDVQDDFSGVKEIQYGFDFDDSGKFEKEKGEKPETLSLPDRDGTWRFSLPTKDLKPGRYAVLVIATDRVGNSNSAKEYVTIEQPLPPPPPLEAKKTSTIKGRVVSGEGEPISGASVTLEGSSFSGTSDNDGRFTFKDVPHGNYKILTRGAVKNKEVSNSMEITLPASEEPAQVKIVLKW